MVSQSLELLLYLVNKITTGLVDLVSGCLGVDMLGVDTFLWTMGARATLT